VSCEWQVLAEYDGAGALQRYYVYGNYIDEPLVMHRESDDKDYYYAQDHLYSVVALTDDNGSVVEIQTSQHGQEAKPETHTFSQAEDSTNSIPAATKLCTIATEHTIRMPGDSCSMIFWAPYRRGMLTA